MENEDKKPASEGGRHLSMPGRLKLGVGVRADFAVQIDFFVLRGDPFHERGSLRVFNTKQRIAQSQEKEEPGNPLDQQLSPLRVCGLSAAGMTRLEWRGKRVVRTTHSGGHTACESAIPEIDFLRWWKHNP